MKKFLLVAALVSVSSSAFAQIDPLDKIANSLDRMEQNSEMQRNYANTIQGGALIDQARYYANLAQQSQQQYQALAQQSRMTQEANAKLTRDNAALTAQLKQAQAKTNEDAAMIKSLKRDGEAIIPWVNGLARAILAKDNAKVSKILAEVHQTPEGLPKYNIKVTISDK